MANEFASIYSNYTLSADAAPNTGGGPTNSFVNPDRYHPLRASLGLNIDGPAVSTVTVTVWIQDMAIPATGAANKYVAWFTGVVITQGTQTNVALPPFARVFIQVTAKSGAPLGLLGGTVPT
jgi:hypothetical protein